MPLSATLGQTMFEKATWGKRRRWMNYNFVCKFLLNGGNECANVTISASFLFWPSYQYPDLLGREGKMKNTMLNCWWILVLLVTGLSFLSADNFLAYILLYYYFIPPFLRNNITIFSFTQYLWRSLLDGFFLNFKLESDKLQAFTVHLSPCLCCSIQFYLNAL